MPFIPTMQPVQSQALPPQHPLAPSNQANVANALKAPQGAATAADDLTKAMTKPGNNTLFSGLFGNPSTGSIQQPNALLPYGANWNGAPTGTDSTLNLLGD